MLQKKLNNQFTLNLDDEYKQLVIKLAEYYQRKPAELLRLLIQPLLCDEYAKVMQLIHVDNKSNFKRL